MSVMNDVAVVRAFTDNLRAGAIAACLELVTEDLVFSEAASLPFGGDYHGKDGVLKLLRNVSRDYRVVLDAPEIVGGDAFVAVRVRGTMRSKATSAEMAMQVLDVYQLRDGLISRIDVFYQDPVAVARLIEADSDHDSDHDAVQDAEVAP